MEKERKKLHYNEPQLLFFAILAQINVCIWGRATGKTEGPISMFSYNNMLKMARSAGAFLGITYESLLLNIIPGVVQGWEKLGLIQDRHYFVRKWAPDAWRWPRAYRAPLKAEHYISMYNGSGAFLMSCDRSVNNGKSLDWLAVDEARFMKQDKLRETLLTVRGNAAHFGDQSCHHSILFCSDMPRRSSEKWLIENYRKQMESEVIEGILMIQVQLSTLKQQLDELSAKERAASGDEAEQKKLARKRKAIESKIHGFLADLNELRKGTVYFSTASTLDNIHALGVEVLKSFKRMLSEIDFRISVLNEQIAAVENGFYSSFDEERHTYTAANFNFMDELELDFRSSVEKDCRWDDDLIPDEPLEIACDYNSDINSMVVGQDNGAAYRVINALFVKKPLRLKDLVRKFCNYYRWHGRKEVNYYYDNTAIAENASTDFSFKDEWIKELREHGWTVNDDYIGQAPGHTSRHWLWQQTFQGDDPRLQKFEMNATNCAQLIVSMQNCAAKRVGKKIMKNKATETDGKTPPEEAPHLSDALDTLWYTKQRIHITDSHAHDEPLDVLMS